MAYKNLARRLKFLIDSYRRHGASHIVEVFRRERIRRAYARSPIDLPSRSEFQSNFAYPGGTQHFMTRFDMAASRRLPMSLSRRREFQVSLLQRVEPADSILSSAELVAEGRFTMLGLSIAEPDGEFKWNDNVLGRGCYPAIPFNRIDFMGGDGSDVKYTWELNRCYWIAWLGKAYWATSNGAWSRDFSRMIDSWSKANPVNVGINWTMPMEVAIRSYWLVMGYAFFFGAPNIDADWWLDYLRLAWGHGCYLHNNLEYFSNLTNHYIANLLGLVAVGSLFADSTVGRAWMAEGGRRLSEELTHQVLPDGVHYERSIAYHRLVLEFYLSAALLLQRAGLPLPPHALARIERMAEFVCDVVHPGGVAPQFGDSDDGILHRLSNQQEIYNFRDTLSVAAVMFERGDFRAVAGEFGPTPALLFGAAGYEVYRKLLPSPPNRSALYPSGGFAILRADRLHVVADVGPIGLHGNNDTLAFALAVDGRPVIVDPGTYCYTRQPSRRNELRGSGAHNGPSFEGLELAEFDGLWRVHDDDIGVEVLEWRPGGVGSETRLSACHRAYRRFAPGSSVTRQWSVSDDAMVVHDSVVGMEGMRCRVRLTLAHDITARTCRGGIDLLDETGSILLSLRSETPMTIRSGWYSPSYGVGLCTLWVDLEVPSPGALSVQYRCPPLPVAT